MDSHNHPKANRPTIGPMEDDPYLSLDQAAAELGMKTYELFVLMNRGNIAGIWVPSRKGYYLLKTEVVAYKAAHPG